MLETFGPDITRKPGYREALIELSIVTNAALAAFTVQQEMGSSAQGGVRAVYGVYLIGSRQVWAPHRGTAGRTGLADPPRDLADFVEFGNAVIQSDRITSLLNSG